MTSLVRVELTRLRWRRAVLLLLLGCLVVPALIAASTLWGTRPVSESELAEVRAGVAGEIARCEQRPGRYGVPRAAPERCEQLLVGWNIGREPLSLARERAGSGIAVTGLLTVLLMLAATTFVGHDWNSGSMSNQLLFQPRRGRVWAAKALAVTGLAGVVAAAVSSAYWLTLWSVARARDLPLRDGALGDCLELGLRGAGFAAAAALGCYALTMLLRSTVATLGVLFAVAVLGVLFVGVLGIGERWQPQVNVAAVVQNGTTYWVDVPERCWTSRGPVPDGSECDDRREVGPVHGVLYLGAPLLAVGAASVLSFRRRDVP
ncbi:hypothetical protein [Nocardioides sp. Arc9.136]|uniref:hypothetical protein n=1 Tax=Nocardioides sp. Arc9.136 TaxID=2996826 RepID=UPI002665AA42|nr:hypothetical protein [Nocardioides sp. Arc9.136]WKN46966.1 hypothetical protein OSR43_13060 [Nocardioides sp. Arc9.136]